MKDAPDRVEKDIAFPVIVDTKMVDALKVDVNVVTFVKVELIIVVAIKELTVIEDAVKVDPDIVEKTVELAFKEDT